MLPRMALPKLYPGTTWTATFDITSDLVSSADLTSGKVNFIVGTLGGDVDPWQWDSGTPQVSVNAAAKRVTVQLTTTDTTPMVGTHWACQLRVVVGTIVRLTIDGTIHVAKTLPSRAAQGWEPEVPVNPVMSSATIRSYYDGDNGVVETSGKVSAWNDLGPDAKNFTQNLTQYRMTPYKNWRNGRHGVWSNGVDSGLSASPANIAAPVTLYVVTEWPDPTTGAQKALIQANSNNFQIAQMAGASVGLGTPVYQQQAAIYGGSLLSLPGHAPSAGTPCIIRAVFNGTNSSLRITMHDGFTRTITGDAGSGFYGGSATLNGWFAANWGKAIASQYFYAGVPSDADDTRFMSDLCDKYNIVPKTYQTPVVSCVGNSYTRGDSGPFSIPTQLQKYLGNAARCDNWGHAAYTTPMLTALLATEGVTSLVDTACCMYLWEGGNDLLGAQTPAQAWQHYVDFVVEARNLGWTKPIVCCTLFPRADVSQGNIDSFNALMEANFRTAGFSACDIGMKSDPALQVPGQVDGIHPTYFQNDVAAQRLANMIRTMVL